MSVYKRGEIYWFKFTVHGKLFRESSGSKLRKAATQMEQRRRAAIEQGGRGVVAIKRPLTFREALDVFLKSKAARWSANSQRIGRTNGQHLLPFFGKMLLMDIRPEDVGEYQSQRKQSGASPKTINLEYGTLRAVLRRHRFWADLQPDVQVLRTEQEVGRALSTEEWSDLVVACRESRSRSLPVAVVLATYTGLRNSELRLLKWKQINLPERSVTVGKSKTIGGEGRIVPLADSVISMLKGWKEKFSAVEPEHYVFPSERYGLAGEAGYETGEAIAYDIRPDVPISSWKTAWNTARKRAGVQCRWHDLRHTFVSLLATDPNSDQTVMALAGHLSRKMLNRYSHIDSARKRQAVDGLDRRLLGVSVEEDDGHKIGHRNDSKKSDLNRCA